MRIIRWTFIDFGADHATKEPQQRRAVIQTGDRRRERIHGLVGNAAALLMAGKIVAMDVWFKLFQL